MEEEYVGALVWQLCNGCGGEHVNAVSSIIYQYNGKFSQMGIDAVRRIGIFRGLFESGHRFTFVGESG